MSKLFRKLKLVIMAMLILLILITSCKPMNENQSQINLEDYLFDQEVISIQETTEKIWIEVDGVEYEDNVHFLYYTVVNETDKQFSMSSIIWLHKLKEEKWYEQKFKCDFPAIKKIVEPNSRNQFSFIIDCQLPKLNTPDLEIEESLEGEYRILIQLDDLSVIVSDLFVIK